LFISVTLLYDTKVTNTLLLIVSGICHIDENLTDTLFKCLYINFVWENHSPFSPSRDSGKTIWHGVSISFTARVLRQGDLVFGSAGR
jgi:hypothetical protein